MGRPTLITLFTDAGFCPRTKLASWAIWAKANGVVIRRSGMLKDRPSDSGVAELRAMANGIILVLREMRPGPGAKIIAQTDCLTIIGALMGARLRKKAARERMQSAVDHVRLALADAGVTVEYRHVPGHAGKGTPRTAVNVECDKECRRLLKAAREAKPHTKEPE